MTDRKKPGRPRLDKEVQRKRAITLSDALADKARKIGGGNISQGIRRALEQCSENPTVEQARVVRR